MNHNSNTVSRNEELESVAFSVDKGANFDMLKADRIVNAVETDRDNNIIEISIFVDFAAADHLVLNDDKLLSCVVQLTKLQ